jgi:hypothetical protein
LLNASYVAGIEFTLFCVGYLRQDLEWLWDPTCLNLANDLPQTLFSSIHWRRIRPVREQRTPFCKGAFPGQVP